MSKKRQSLVSSSAKTTALVAAEVALDSAGSGGATAIALALDAWTTKRRRRMLRRLSDLATVMLTQGVPAEGLAKYIDILADTDEGAAVVEALFREIDSAKMWAYGALIARFAGSDDLTATTKVHWLSFCRDSTGPELLGFVFATCRKSVYYAYSDQDRATMPAIPDDAVLQNLIRWRLYSPAGPPPPPPEDQRPRLPERRVERFNIDRVSLDGVELAYVLLPFARDRIVWPHEPLPREQHGTIQFHVREAKRKQEKPTR